MVLDLRRPFIEQPGNGGCSLCNHPHAAMRDWIAHEPLSAQRRIIAARPDGLTLSVHAYKPVSFILFLLNNSIPLPGLISPGPTPSHPMILLFTPDLWSSTPHMRRRILGSVCH